MTDVMEVWAWELGGCPALSFRCPPEEHGAMLRAALGHGAAELSLGPGSTTLRLPEELQCPRPAARRRGAQPAASVGLQHGRLHGEAPGSKRAPSGVNFEDS